MVRSFFRGNEIIIKDNGCFYADNLISTVGYERDCGYCGKGRTEEGHDGCLGTLENVVNACCGHGNKNEAYVQFDDNTIRGNEAIKYIAESKAS